MWWVLGVVVVAALLSVYLGWTAQRVERVHVRARSAERALEAHLLRRAAAAAVVAEHADATELYAAARSALDAEPEEREAAENNLTRQLQSLPLPSPAFLDDPAMRTLIATSRRAVVARQVHTDLVRDALTARRRPLVRMLRMARRYPQPTYFDIVEPTLPDLPAPRRAPALAAETSVAADSAIPVEAG
jgi:hypothetical protein